MNQISANPVLVQSMRGEVVESFHRGVVCVVNKSKEVIYSLGNIEQVCYPRSSMKFFQHIPFFSRGGAEKFDLTLEEIALICSSHNGEKHHIETVNKLLSRGGFTEDDLECGPQMPEMAADQAELIKKDLKPGRIYNNCSGKHTGFLLFCKLLGVDHKNYISPEHPIQKIIAETCSRYYETPMSQTHVGIDGCSAPIFSYSVYKQAVAYQNLINPVGFPPEEQKACALMVKAVTSYPFMIAGSKRYCTELMEVAGDKVVGKTGADGVYCMSVFDKNLSVCIKVDDGKMGVQYVVAQALLSNSGLIDKEQAQKLKKYVQYETKNFGGLTIGEIRPNPEINFNIYQGQTAQ
ncbi:MAG: asparaginase [Bacteroidetes bacterium]|nr:asparaginase [Bacteroidota bacterium]